jgi:uncharacterized protein (DUF1330 family)
VAAYVVVDVEVQDPEAYQEYTRQVPDTLQPYGGKFIVRGGNAQTLEGAWNPKRVVILEFPTAQQAKGWHASAAYQAILPIRQRNARTNFLTVVEGV